jgi:hypothetical protein
VWSVAAQKGVISIFKLGKGGAGEFFTEEIIYELSFED